MVAHYRRQHLIVRGYGNYVWLGQSAALIAHASVRRGRLRSRGTPLLGGSFAAPSGGGRVAAAAAIARPLLPLAVPPRNDRR